MVAVTQGPIRSSGESGADVGASLSSPTTGRRPKMRRDRLPVQHDGTPSVTENISIGSGGRSTRGRPRPLPRIPGAGEQLAESFARGLLGDASCGFRPGREARARRSAFADEARRLVDAG